MIWPTNIETGSANYYAVTRVCFTRFWKGARGKPPINTLSFFSLQGLKISPIGAIIALLGTERLLQPDNRKSEDEIKMSQSDYLREKIAYHQKFVFGALAIITAILGWAANSYQETSALTMVIAFTGAIIAGLVGEVNRRKMHHFIEELKDV